jgi:NAD(P)-dependent dehydrogenase (short-subunit alcohol dehydrogenase family)
MTSKTALIVGSGGVLGQALVQEFASNGYTVVGMRRERHGSSSPPNFRTMSCDLGDPAATQMSVASVISELNHLDVLICNAAHMRVAPLTALVIADFDEAWRAIVGSALGGIRAALPKMAERQSGSILFSGATASIRGSARYAAFASAKFALRGLAQSLAREFQPQGIHVSHIVIDGLLRGSPSQTSRNAPPEKCIDPAHVAKQYRWLAEQDPSSWTHELDIRPSTESF